MELLITVLMCIVQSMTTRMGSVRTEMSEYLIVFLAAIQILVGNIPAYLKKAQIFVLFHKKVS